MTKLTETELEAIRARCDAATEGPWHDTYSWRVEGDISICIDDGKGNAHYPIIEGRTLLSSDAKNEANATFIAHSRTDVPALMSHAETMAAEHAIEIAEKDARIRELEGQFNALIDARRIQAKALRDGGEDG